MLMCLFKVILGDMLAPATFEIYLADDHEIVAKTIANLLLTINPSSNIKTFSNGKQLYNACLLKMPNLIILD